ncbi:hypothetical protein EAG_02329 [Camponotus floridanus]|uniref:Fibronectin type III domain-containing protein n=1 Tax=Camponotus floridanus TaxID=104421 RepID=E2A4I9_CAMFO|nr:hypothetical protein EAG_02329 [Camponotus floridanus]
MLRRANATTLMEAVYNVTKIEVELREAPDAVVGSMSSELEAATELNSTFPDGTGAVVVRAEEALIVILVLVLWVAAIALFFNRWGKIRMLEPYQPKFQQQHRQSCSIVDPTPIQVSALLRDLSLPLSPRELTYFAWIASYTECLYSSTKYASHRRISIMRFDQTRCIYILRKKLS